MRDDTPREPIRETPAPDGPPPPGVLRHYETHAPRLEDRPSVGAFGTGILAALGLAGVFVIVEAFALVMVLVAAEGEGNTAALFYVALLVAGLALGAAVLISRRLPKAARTPFWAMGITCIGFVMTVLIGICGIRVAGPGG